MRVSIPAHVVFRSFVDETVLLDLDSGRYHGLNATAGEILEQLAAGRDPADVGRRLAETHGIALERAQADVDGLCARLAERGLVELR